MHVGTRDDRGGNEVLVLWFGEPSNLHSVWDGGMIDRAELSFSELAEKLDVAPPEQVRAWQAGSPLEWADESRRLGEGAYALGDRRLGWKYIFDHWPEVEQRIRQAGARLAGLLDRALGPQRDKAGSWLPVAVQEPVR
jgi:nuclease S1